MKRNGTLGHVVPKSQLKEKEKKEKKVKFVERFLDPDENQSENIFSRFDITHYESGEEEGYESFSDVEADVISGRARQRESALENMCQASLTELKEHCRRVGEEKRAAKRRKLESTVPGGDIISAQKGPKRRVSRRTAARRTGGRAEETGIAKAGGKMGAPKLCVEVKRFATPEDEAAARAKALENRERRVRRRDRTRLRMLEAANDKERERINDTRALAWIRGERVVYAMKTREILIGRETPTSKVDLDVCDEAAGRAVSRRTAIVKLKSDGNFYVRNCGKRYIDLNGRPLAPGQKRRIAHQSLMMIDRVKLLFVVNHTLWNKIRKQIKV
jgi:hypothetical protein